MHSGFLVVAWWLLGSCLVVAWWLPGGLHIACMMVVFWLLCACLEVAWWLSGGFLVVGNSEKPAKQPFDAPLFCFH